MTKDQGIVICESLDLETMLNDEDDVDDLVRNKPDLYDAYVALFNFSYGGDDS